jgi:hypothetical protein
MSHLDAKTYAALLEAPARVDAALRAHLFTDCAQCADFLARQTTADALDGCVDAALLRKVPRSAIPLADGAHLFPARRAIPFGALAAVAGLVLALGVGVTLGRRSPVPGAEDGIKGSATLTVESSFVIVAPDGTIHRGVAGGVAPAGSALSVRVALSDPARVSVVRQGADGTDVLLLNAPMERGAHDLAQGGAPVGIALRGLSGRQQVKVVASARVLGPDEVLQAARGGAVPGTVTSWFDVVAQP